MFLNADSEDSDQTGRMLGVKVILLVLSRGSSNIPVSDSVSRFVQRSSALCETNVTAIK